MQLTCEVEGKGGIQYVWMHDNQTLVKGAGPCRQKKAELIIEQMTEADQGEYVCRFTNAFGFAVSEPVTLRLGMLHLLQFFLAAAVVYPWRNWGHYSLPVLRCVL